MRTYEEILKSYRDLQLEVDAILRIMDDKHYEFSTKIADTNEGCQAKINSVEHCKAETSAHLLDGVDTEKGKAILNFHFKKWGKEENVWYPTKETSLAHVFESAHATKNYLKLEIALNAILSANGNIEKANKEAKRSYADMKSDTPNIDTFIFNSAAKIAEVDGVKLENPKNK